MDEEDIRPGQWSINPTSCKKKKQMTTYRSINIFMYHHHKKGTSFPRHDLIQKSKINPMLHLCTSISIKQKPYASKLANELEHYWRTLDYLKTKLIIHFFKPYFIFIYYKRMHSFLKIEIECFHKIFQSKIKAKVGLFVCLFNLSPRKQT